MPEGWAMAHKDRLYDLEFAEEQLADVRNSVLEDPRHEGPGSA